MNLPTVLISLFIIAMFVLAIRHIIKKGTCGCNEKDSSHSGCPSCCNHSSSDRQKSFIK
jgi:hypothetical protein